jgi:hypothetical protein
MVYAALLEALALAVYYGTLLVAAGLALLLALLPGPGHGAGLLTMLVAAPVMQSAILVPEWLALPWSLYFQEYLAGWLTQGLWLDPLIRAGFWFPPIALNALLLLVVHRLGRALLPVRERP